MYGASYRDGRMIRSCGVRWVDMFTAAADEFSIFLPPTAAQYLEKIFCTEGAICRFIIPGNLCRNINPSDADKVAITRSSIIPLIREGSVVYGYFSNPILVERFERDVVKKVSIFGLTTHLAKDAEIGESVRILSPTVQMVESVKEISSQSDIFETLLGPFDIYIQNGLLCQVLSLWRLLSLRNAHHPRTDLFPKVFTSAMQDVEKILSTEGVICSFIIPEFSETGVIVGLTTHVAKDAATGESVESVNEISSQPDIFERLLAPFDIQNDLLCKVNISGRGLAAGGLTAFFSNDPETGETISSFIILEFSETSEIVGITTPVAKDPETRESPFGGNTLELPFGASYRGVVNIPLVGTNTTVIRSSAVVLPPYVAKDPYSGETVTGIYSAIRTCLVYCHFFDNIVAETGCGKQECPSRNTSTLVHHRRRIGIMLYDSRGKPFNNPYGFGASPSFASNTNYGEPGCKFCQTGNICSLDLKTDPVFRTSTDGDIPCLYCNEGFRTPEGVHHHQMKRHPFLFCPRESSKKCEKCGNSYFGNEKDHRCPSPSNQ